MPRRLLTGLLLAIALHWAVLDYWRGQWMFAQENSADAPQLQLVIAEARPQVSALSEAPATVVQGEPPAQVAIQKSAIPVLSSPDEAATEELLAARAPATSLADRGFRDMNIAEALVFYRIELARRLDPRLFAAGPSAKLMISLDSGGEASAWRLEDGRAAPGGWEDAIRATEVPAVLKGRVQEIVLEIRP